MAESSSLMWPMLIIVAGAGIGGYIWMQRDKTPVGLVVTNAIQGGETLGVNEDGDTITMGSVEGTWRKDENSLSVASESAEKPLLVIYQDGTQLISEILQREFVAFQLFLHLQGFTFTERIFNFFNQ